MGATWKFEKSKNDPLEIYEDLVIKDKRTQNKFRIMAYVSLTGFILAIAALVYALTLPRTVPVLITMSDWGEAKYVGEINKLSYQGIKVPQIAIEYQLRKFVSNYFSIPGDPDILKKNLVDCYSCLTSETADKLSSQLKENNPLKNYGSVRKTVDIESILTLSKNSYQVDFIISTTNPRNQNIITTRMRGVLTVSLLEPDEDDKILNPLGIYISSYDFREIK